MSQSDTSATLGNPNYAGLTTGGLATGQLSDRPSTLKSGAPIESRRDFRESETTWEGQPFITEVKSPDFGEGGILFQPPFRLYVNIDDTTYTWAVDSDRSTVIDGTNGTPFDLSAAGAAWAIGAIKFDTETVFVATTDIVLEADIDTSGAPSNWTLAAVTYANAVEVSVDAGPPAVQDKVRLLIGTVYVETVDTQLVVRAEQALTSAVMLGWSFYNGLLVRTFKHCSTRRAP